MSTRLVPAYVECAGWEVWNAYQEFLDTDDFDRLRDSIAGLRDALLRGRAVTYAPADVLIEWLAALPGAAE